MHQNPILEELYAARRKILADCNGNTLAYLREAQARLEASGRPIADLPRRTIRRRASSIDDATEKEDAAPFRP